MPDRLVTSKAKNSTLFSLQPECINNLHTIDLVIFTCLDFHLNFTIWGLFVKKMTHFYDSSVIIIIFFAIFCPPRVIRAN